MWYCFRQLLFKYRKKGVKCELIKYFCLHNYLYLCSLFFHMDSNSHLNSLIAAWITSFSFFLVRQFYQQIPWGFFLFFFFSSFSCNLGMRLFCFNFCFLNHFIVVCLTCKQLCTHLRIRHQLQYTKFNCISILVVNTPNK